MTKKRIESVSHDRPQLDDIKESKLENVSFDLGDIDDIIGNLSENQDDKPK